MSTGDSLDTQTTWLSPEDIETVRGQVPIVYVDAIPVRLDMAGNVTEVGLLLRAMPDGTVSRAVVSGRVLYGETVRDALLRHLARDLGPAADPRLPPSPAPFTIAEYFPDADITGFHDPRQHAVSLVYLVPVDGVCAPGCLQLGLHLGHPRGSGIERGPGRDDRRPGPVGDVGAGPRRLPALVGPSRRFAAMSADLIARFWELESSHRFAELAPMFADDAVYYDPLVGRLDGRPAIAAFAAKIEEVSAAAGIRTRLVDCAGDADCGWARFVMNVGDSADIAGQSLYRIEECQLGG